MNNPKHKHSRVSVKIRVFKMTVGLALLGLVNAITIDNQLVMMQNECYQRIAIGERIPDANVYKVLDVRTVDECQFECSKANENCMALSFGISSRGNTSCIISRKSIVNDVKMISPQDSIRDPDFDLYSKKADCRPHKIDPDGFNTPQNRPYDRPPPIDQPYQPDNYNRPHDNRPYPVDSFSHGRPPYDRPYPPSPPSAYDNVRPPGGDDLRPYDSRNPGRFYPERRPLTSGTGPSIISYGHDNHGGMVTSIITEIIEDSSTTGK